MVLKFKKKDRINVPFHFNYNVYNVAVKSWPMGRKMHDKGVNSNNAEITMTGGIMQFEYNDLEK
jgi:hypothetical protein